jgi:DNA-binding SARP family transcriptional activator
MTPPIVFAGKLRRPDVAGMMRSRLVGPLLTGAPGGLDLVIAPPGSGKTTLLSRIAAESGAPTAWYRVTADDGAEAAVTAHLAASLRGALQTELPADPTMDALLGALQEWTGQAAIVVIDDLHEIADSPAEAAVGRFIELRPPALRVLIGSRRQPGINVPRLRVSGALREITSDDLRFRSWEVEELFTGFFREPLLPEAAAALTRRTGGWAAGLQLFHLATAGRSPAERAQAVTDLGGRSKLVRSYLARNVLDLLGEERRQFLLRTCTLGVITASLCDALLEITGSARILDELEHQQLFTSSADDGQTFRYHEVLRTHLELALVEEFGPVGARSWYARAAALLEAAGHPHAAARAFAAAEDWPAVARLVRQDRPQFGGTGAALLLPAAVVRHDPWLALVDARRRLRDGSVVAADAAFVHAGTLLDEPTFRDRCERERAVSRMWSPPSDAKRSERDPDHWSTPVRAALRGVWDAAPAGRPVAGQGAGAPGQLGAVASRRLATGLVALLAGDIRVAASLLQTAREIPTEDRAVAASAGLASVVADLIAGVEQDPATRLTETAGRADADGLPWIARLARGLGECVLIAQGAPDWRVAASEAMAEECDRLDDPWGAALLRLAVAVAEHISGSTDPGPGYQDAAARFRALDAPTLETWALTLGAIRTSTATGTPQPARTAAAIAADQGVAGAATLALMTATVLSAATTGAGVTVDSAVGAGSAPLRAAALAVLCASVSRSPSNASSDDRPSNRPTRTSPIPDQRSAATAERQVEWDGVGDSGSEAPKVASSAPTVVIACFGGFRITIDARPISLDDLRPRARSLLRLLAVSAPDAMHRERLVDALWPDADLAAGTRRLQVAISSIRRLLQDGGIPGEIIVRDGDAYGLILPPGSEIDVAAFERALRAASTAVTRGDPVHAVAAHREAMALYTGELLPEEGPAEYLVAARERLRLAAAGAAAAAARESRQLGELGEAIAAARRSVELDPFQDTAWELLAELHTDAGDHLAAAQARRDHSRAIAELERIEV